MNVVSEITTTQHRNHVPFDLKLHEPKSLKICNNLSCMQNLFNRILDRFSKPGGVIRLASTVCFYSKRIPY